MSSAIPDALLFVAPGCPHCPAMLRGVNALMAEGLIDQLTVLNVVEHADQATEYGVRTAPWLRLGAFILTGAHSLTELRRWAQWARGEEGSARYVQYLLQQANYPQAVAFVAADTQRLKPLLTLLADVSTGIDIRVGMSAILERYANTAELQNLLPQLGALTFHEDHRVRADVCYLLGRTGAVAARPYLGTCLNDANLEVREIAQEALEELGLEA
ncbi:MAG: HEAT repeat domain-containing protein [Gallionellaceae bacterium]